MNITELADHFGSDKGSKKGNPPHRYSYLYDLIFNRYQNLELNLLEIGLAVGGPELGGPIERKVESPSLQIWLEYFPNAHIFGFDISDFSHISCPRFTFTQGDSGSEADLRRLADRVSHYDIIIDDASHASYHQQLALKILFPKLSCGGLYIIEDLHWQPDFEKSLPKVPKTADFLNRFFESDEYIHNHLFSIEEIDRLKAETESFVSFPDFGRAISWRQVLTGAVKSEAATKVIVLRKATLALENAGSSQTEASPAQTRNLPHEQTRMRTGPRSPEPAR